MAGLRERKRADARSSTIDHALALFAERGYDDVTVADICTAADIGRRTFFRYFSSKDELLFEPVKEITEHVTAAIAEIPADVPDDEALRMALIGLVDDLVEHRDRFVRIRQVLPTTLVARTSSFAVQSEQEARTASNLLARRGETGPPDWRIRVMVARTAAAFRVWFDDFLDGGFDDPRAHLLEILDLA